MTGIARRVTTSAVLISAILFAHGTAAAGPGSNPSIGIIIDDIGYRLRDDLRAIAIPGALAYAILPHSPHARRMSRLAHSVGKLVLVHQPMESARSGKNAYLGPGVLWLDMTHDQFLRTLTNNLRSLPEAMGVNNHEGSLLTRHPGRMEWLMDGLKQSNKFFIDSVTSKDSIAGRIAGEMGVPCLRRDVFLDNERSQAYIKGQLDELARLARLNGQALGIGHPHPETIRVLSRELRELDKYGVNLVSLTDLLIYSRSASTRTTKPTAAANQATSGTPANRTAAVSCSP
jgi:polysaccharide deacetylase 2 family uncharacterized protein YibQ